MSGVNIGATENNANSNINPIKVNIDSKSKNLSVSKFLKELEYDITIINESYYKPFDLFFAMITDISYAFYKKWFTDMILLKEEICGIDDEGPQTNSYRLNRAKEIFQYVIINYTDKNALINNLFELMNDTEPGMENDT